MSESLISKPGNSRAWILALSLSLSGGLPALTPPADATVPPIRPVRTTGLAADAAAIILSGQQGGDLPIAALATPAARQEGGLAVPISIEIDAGILFDFETSTVAAPSAAGPEAAASAGSQTEPDEPEPERLEIIVYMLGSGGVEIQDSLLQAYEIDAHRLSDTRRGLRFVAELNLPRPPGVARVMVRLQQREALGVVSLPIEGASAAPPAPAPPSGAGGGADSATAPAKAQAPVAASPVTASAGLTPPLIAAGDGWLRLPWILPSGVLPPLPEPFASQPMASRAVLTRGEPLFFTLLASGLDAVDSRLTLELIGDDGRLSAQVGGDVKSYSAPLADGRRHIRIEATTADLPLGSYGLVAVLTAGGEPHRSPPLQVLVLDDLVLEEAETAEEAPDGWPWLLARLTAPRAPTLASGRAANSAVDHRQLTEGLDEVYAGLAKGEETAARRRHLRLALAIAKDHGSLGLKTMAKEEFERARALAGTEIADRPAPDTVLPLVALNLELYREARRLGRTLVSTHARFMTLRLVELYLASASNSAPARRTAATLLVSLGGELQLADMVYFSERMFRKALSYDDRQETALLALGMTYHLLGDVQRARDTFDALLSVDPKHAEGNLRMARLEKLEGDERGARRLLERALAGDGPTWVRAVAYQELARLDIDDGEIDDAIATLRRGIEELPDQPRLAILLSFAYDAKAWNEEARTVLARAKADASSRPSPRRRFGDWSRESFVRNDRRVQERINQAVPAFAERLPLLERREQ